MLALTGTTRGAQHWLGSSVTVTVRNGVLTLSNGPRSGGNELDAVNIQQISALPSAAIAARFSIQAAQRAAAQAAAAAQRAAAQAALAGQHAAALAALRNRHHR